MKYSFIYLLFLFYLGISVVYGFDIYLSPNGTDIDGCGSSTGSACFSLQGAKQYLVDNKIVIYNVLMAPGYYDYRFIPILELNNIYLLVVSGEAGRANETIITMSDSGEFISLFKSLLRLNQLTIAHSTIGKVPYNRIVLFPSSFGFDSILLTIRPTISDFYLQNSTLIVDNVTFFNNTRKLLILAEGSLFVFRNSTIQKNIYDVLFEFTESSVLFTGPRIISNSLTLAIMSANDTYITLNRALFIYNYSIYGIIFYETYFYLNSSRIQNNVSRIGILISINSKIILQNCIIQENISSTSSGIIYISETSSGYISTCIINGNFGPSVSDIGTASTSYEIMLTIFSNSSVNQHSISMYDSGSLTIQDCAFFNINGTIIRSDSRVSVVVMYTLFHDIDGVAFDIDGGGFLLMISNFIRDCTSRDALFRFTDRAYFLAAGLIVISTKSSKLISASMESKVYLYICYFENNEVDNGLIYGKELYQIYLSSSIFQHNTGTTLEGLISLDQTGVFVAEVTRATNNYAPYGTFITYRELDDGGQNRTCISEIDSSTFIDNRAWISGATVYYMTPDIICKVIFNNSHFINSTSTFGGNINSYYNNFSVILPRILDTPEVIQVSIAAFDAFGNDYRGSNEISFYVQERCDNVNISGIQQVSLTPTGKSIMYNIEISGFPGTSCDLIFTSIPPARTGPLAYNIIIIPCKKDYKPYAYQGKYYCLKQRDISHTSIVAFSVLTAVLMAITLVFGIMILVYWKNIMIQHSNPYFLLTVIVGLLFIAASNFLLFGTSTFSCIGKLVAVPIGVILCVNPVIIKEWRIWKTRKDSYFEQKSNLETFFLFKWLIILSIIPIILLIVNVAVSNSKPMYVYDIDKREVSHVCSNPEGWVYIVITLVYLMILLMICCAYVYMGRRYLSSPGSFNEPTYIGILIYNYIILIIVFISLRFSFPNNYNAQYITTASVDSAFILCTLLLLFCPKFYLTKFIEYQKKELVRNKDILQFYQMYCNDQGQLNLANHDIFTPDTPAQPTIIPDSTLFTSSSVDSTSPPSPSSSSSSLTTKNKKSKSKTTNNNIYNNNISHSIPDPNNLNLPPIISDANDNNVINNDNNVINNNYKAKSTSEPSSPFSSSSSLDEIFESQNNNIVNHSKKRKKRKK
ncbi:G-protein-coupled receptor family 3 protein 15 [Heterostelium album PN500]|uniref:G-protein-coupled receptor family 3 protein 15 n=1 Tax=Heterostelium pallidum (strain ATCC 26659 / Pp 5 / PN500) TaxID=670386 RepID=D3BN43_HETP5|nr:G-protein-coupled receptor family 3 protein 15 [Heterostelium album PN500]EFA77405.1 G-protein-coupled receptor family 3 protein 15 [Heterostelium album PN500]|eukprot:XP_020429534.1 G-protein-coupled receptor family 3 protein 15 [Heterostelium album PN500]